MTTLRVPVVQNILSANDHVAGLNRSQLDDNRVF